MTRNVTFRYSMTRNVTFHNVTPRNDTQRHKKSVVLFFFKPFFFSKTSPLYFCAFYNFSIEITLIDLNNFQSWLNSKLTEGPVVGIDCIQLVLLWKIIMINVGLIRIEHLHYIFFFLSGDIKTCETMLLSDLHKEAPSMKTSSKLQ